MARFNAFVRGVLLTCAVVVGGLIVVWLAVKSQVNDEIRSEVERRFAERYREFRVSVRHARMYEGRGVEIHGLSIARRADNRPLAYVNEVFAECQVDAEALLSGQRPQAKHVYLVGLETVGRVSGGRLVGRRAVVAVARIRFVEPARDGPRRHRGGDRPARRRAAVTRISATLAWRSLRIRELSPRLGRPPRKRGRP